MLRARFITCFIWISSNVSGERPNYAEAWLVDILCEKVGSSGSSFIFLGGKFHPQLFPCQLRKLSKKQKTFGLFVAAVLSAAKPMLLIRPSKALGPDSHLEMDKNIKNNHMNKEQRFNFYMYSFYSLYLYRTY